MSWYGSTLLIIAQYRAFQNSPISFVVETTYKDWNTQFPSIAVCEQDNSVRIGAVSDGLWGKDHDFNMEEVLKEIAFFKGVTYYVSEVCQGEDSAEECFKSNLTYYAKLVRSECNDVMSNCSWNQKSFDCCQYFRPVETEIGPCFIINTIQGGEAVPILKMHSNRATGPGRIQFEVMLPVSVYILNEEDVPSLSYLGSEIMNVGLETHYRRYITVKNIENDATARMITPEKRRCRYSDENNLKVYPYYSYSACTVQCRKDAQMRLCNCSNFFMPNTPEDEKCDLNGIICLNDKVNLLSVLRARWSTHPGLFCDCLPSCTEAELTIVKDFIKPITLKYSTVEIQLSVLPSERYRRNVVRGVLDLVVSTGGTGGLFLGVSILSVLELIYTLLLRPFFDIYSQRNEDPWHKKYGNRRIEDSKFKKTTNKLIMKKELKPKT
ncbi:sodium channel protein Nach [Danaus plexippus]|uniref:sodium channel protein Nach n=1 Tax=Danaus plexippus TaxID=13037 RepID=UPI002AAF7D9A|nr:sodium channel protein Nach [Danaus plexippus]